MTTRTLTPEQRQRKRERDRQYYAANRDYWRQYNEANRDHLLQYQRQYNAAHRDQKSEWRKDHYEQRREEKRRYRQSLPPITYSYWDGTTCVYVGSGTRLRLPQHRSKSPWWTPDLRVEVQEHESLALARSFEYLLIHYEQPLHNVDGIRRRT